MMAARHRPAGIGALFPGETPFSLTMVHDLYVACALMGGQEPVQLCAQMRSSAGGESDLAMAELRWPDDVWGSFTATFLTPKGMSEEGFDVLEVFGDGWAARLRLNPQPIEIWADRQHWPIGLNIYDDPRSPSGWLAEELRHFCRVVRGAAEVPLGARYSDAVQVLRWIEILERSAREESKC
jgi:predicted dehydrogenase